MLKQEVIITGADGFIGSHLTRELASRDYLVYAIVMPSSTTKARIRDIQNVQTLEYEICPSEALISRLPHAPSALFHLAWAGVAPEQRNNYEVQLSNVSMALNCARIADRIQAQRFILPGSTMEYSYGNGPIGENARPAPQNAYGAAKVAARYICSAYCLEHSVPFIYAALSSIYAADRLDSNVISYTIRKLLNGERPSLTRLEQKWDYIHINDVIEALCLIAESGKGGAAYVIGHGDRCTLADYIRQIRDSIDPNLPLGIGELPYPNDRMPNASVDLTSLTRDTGYSPAISFQDGIRGVIDSIKAEREEVR